jgi:hypothetical protein
MLIGNLYFFDTFFLSGAISNAAKFTIFAHLYLLRWLRPSGAVRMFSLYDLSPCTGTSLLLPLLFTLERTIA